MTVSLPVYESAVKGRQDFRRALLETRLALHQARDFIASLREWPDDYFSDPKWARAWRVAVENELQRLALEGM